MFDWYTTLVGVFTLCVLAGHGALYLVWKTAGPVQARSQTCEDLLWPRDELGVPQGPQGRLYPVGA